MKSHQDIQPNETITIPLKDLLWICLGDEHSGSPCKGIPLETAAVLEFKLKNSLIYKVVFDDQEGQPLTIPLVWWKKDYDNESSTYTKHKLWAHRDKVSRWLMDANVHTVAKAIMKKAGIPEEDAKGMAYGILKNPNSGVVLREFFGINKIKTKEEEL